MSFAYSFANRPARVTLRHFFWLHPEWWCVGLCGLAWALMLRHGLQETGHQFHQRLLFAPELLNWMLMVAAMMLPLVVDRVEAAAERSLWARRHRAIAGFLAGYFSPWLLLGFAAAALREAPWTHTYAAPALGFVVAALWQRTRMHNRALLECHRNRPLAPLGWRADFDCFHFGATIGSACVRSCWPLMVACALAAHSPIALVGCMIVSAAERLSYRPRTRTMLLVTLAMASYYLVLACLGRELALTSQHPSAPRPVAYKAVLLHLEEGTTNTFFSSHALIALGFAKLSSVPPSCRGSLHAFGLVEAVAHTTLGLIDWTNSRCAS